MAYSREYLEAAYILPPDRDIDSPRHSHDLGYLSFTEVPRYGFPRGPGPSTFVDVIEPGGVTAPKVLTWHPTNFAPMEFEHEFGSGAATLVINKNTDATDEVNLGDIGALAVKQGVTAFFIHNESDDISVVRHNLAVPPSALRELKRETVMGVGAIGLFRHQEFKDPDNPADGSMAVILSEKFRQRFADIMAKRHSQK